ncbi:hypothetical protein AHAS_Ahas03G0164400 [Arachis hypogaea]
MNPHLLQSRVATTPSQPSSRCCECDHYDVVVHRDLDPEVDESGFDLTKNEVLKIVRESLESI